MPHDAAERVCPNTGLRLVTDNRSVTREGRRSADLQHVKGDVRRSIEAQPKAQKQPEPEAPQPSGQHHLIGQNIGGRYVVRGVLGEGV